MIYFKFTKYLFFAIIRSHDGRFIVTGGTAGILRLWSYESGKLITEMSGHSGTINCVSFSNDDKQIVSVSDDGSAYVWYVLVDEK